MERLLAVTIPETDPVVNQQIETRIARTLPFGMHSVRFWTDSPSILCGRFQEPRYETDLDFAYATGVPVMKRFTGGGTVFHDEGVLNFSLNTPYAPHTERLPLPVFIGEITDIAANSIYDWIQSVCHCGNTCLEKDHTNSLFYRGEKILGAAAALIRGRVHFHASLIVNTNAGLISRFCRPSAAYPANYAGVRSKRSPTTSLREITGSTTELSVESLADTLFKGFARWFVIRRNVTSIVHVANEEELPRMERSDEPYDSVPADYRQGGVHV